MLQEIINTPLLFIPNLIEGDYKTVLLKVSLIALMWLCVIGASMVDLITGIAASKRLGVFKTTSKGLRATLTKDLSYMAILVCALLMDVCLSYLSIYLSFFSIPIISICAVVAECAIEMVSVNENVHKGQKEENTTDVLKLAAELIKSSSDDERVKDIITAIEDAASKSKENVK